MNLLTERQAIMQALEGPKSPKDMISFFEGGMWFEDEEKKETAVRYFTKLVESTDPLAAKFVQDLALSLSEK